MGKLYWCCGGPPPRKDVLTEAYTSIRKNLEEKGFKFQLVDTSEALEDLGHGDVVFFPPYRGNLYEGGDKPWAQFRADLLGLVARNCAVVFLNNSGRLRGKRDSHRSIYGVYTGKSSGKCFAKGAEVRLKGRVESHHPDAWKELVGELEPLNCQLGGKHYSPLSPRDKDWDSHSLEESVVLVNEEPGDELPFLIRRNISPRHEPGLVLFLGSGGWTQTRLPRDAQDRPAFIHLCRDAIEVLAKRLPAVLEERLKQRLEHMGDFDPHRLNPTRMRGKERDYHVVLANEPMLLADLVKTDPRRENEAKPSDGEALGQALREHYTKLTVHPEPPYKGPGPETKKGEGRLDLLYVHDADADRFDRQSLGEYLESSERKPVVWVELEAKRLEKAQLERFLSEASGRFQKDDWLVSLDYSRCDETLVNEVRNKVRENERRFVHVSLHAAVREAREALIGELEPLQRRRYTLDAIAVMLGMGSG